MTMVLLVWQKHKMSTFSWHSKSCSDW